MRGDDKPYSDGWWWRVKVVRDLMRNLGYVCADGVRAFRMDLITSSLINSIRSEGERYLFIFVFLPATSARFNRSGITSSITDDIFLFIFLREGGGVLCNNRQ